MYSIREEVSNFNTATNNNDNDDDGDDDDDDDSDDDDDDDDDDDVMMMTMMIIKLIIMVMVIIPAVIMYILRTTSRNEPKAPSTGAILICPNYQPTIYIILLYVQYLLCRIALHVMRRREA